MNIFYFLCFKNRFFYVIVTCLQVRGAMANCNQQAECKHYSYISVRSKSKSRGDFEMFFKHFDSESFVFPWFLEVLEVLERSGG